MAGTSASVTKALLRYNCCVGQTLLVCLAQSRGCGGSRLLLCGLLWLHGRLLHGLLLHGWRLLLMAGVDHALYRLREAAAGDGRLLLHWLRGLHLPGIMWRLQCDASWG